MELREKYRKLSNISGSTVTKKHVLELERLVKTDKRVIKMELLSDKDALKRTMFHVHLELDEGTITDNMSFGAITGNLAESRIEIRDRLVIESRKLKKLEEEKNILMISAMKKIRSRITDYNENLKPGETRLAKTHLLTAIKHLFSGVRMRDIHAVAVKVMDIPEIKNYWDVTNNYELI